MNCHTLKYTFSLIGYNPNLYLVCKLWYRLYRETIECYLIKFRLKINIPVKFLERYKNAYYLDLYRSNIFNISCLENIRILDLSRCKNIMTLPKFNNLIKLNVSSTNIKNIYDILENNKNSIKILNIGWCENINKLPKFKNLVKLNVPSTNIENIYDILKNSRNSIKKLNINWCKNITKLPKFRGLEKFSIVDTNISNIEKILDISKDIIKKLDISWCENIEALPKFSNLGKIICMGTKFMK